MRIFSFLLFAQMLVLLTVAPLANAADKMQLGICNFGYAASYQTSTIYEDNQQDVVKSELENIEEKYTEKYSETFVDDPKSEDANDKIPDDSYCGIENPSTKFIEKGDCTSQVISEVAEVVSSATPTTDDKTNKIVNLYHGVCCLIYDETGTCYETRTYYTDTYVKCTAAANGTGSGVTGGDPNCELRQWIIASTGMGLLKLYVKQIFTFGAFAVGAIAVATIILNGVRISVAGVSGDISEAKQKITQSLSGIVLLFMAALILYSINPDFFGG